MIYLFSGREKPLPENGLINLWVHWMFNELIENHELIENLIFFDWLIYNVMIDYAH